MNDRDSEALLGLFLQRGYSMVDEHEDADIILVNTCSVRGHAEERAISFLGSLKKVTSNKSQARSDKLNTQYSIPNTKIIGLIGCMAASRGQEIAKRMSHIKLICAPSKLYNVLQYIESIKENGKRIIDLEDSPRDEEFYNSPFRIESDHAQVVISTGCSNYCSYCVVPYVRGPLRPRSLQDIINEIRRNVVLGIRKITLLGQNVNDYQYRSQATGHKSQAIKFPDLLREVANIEGVEEIDFVTSHPRNTSLELFRLMASSPKFKKHLHLPFQSGSDRILKLMNRGYSRQDYIDLVRNYTDIVKGTLSTDVIIGFPSETKEDFLQTKDVLERVNFKYAYIFKYSPRPNTEAFLMSDDVTKEDKQRRHNILLELQKDISLAIKSKSNKESK
jgi:tRNA-2-methylthio-N6-dimethylallyladenosine synthase